MINSNYNINFQSRNAEIRKADDLARRINRLYPRISTSAMSKSKYSDKFPRLMSYAWMDYDAVYDLMYGNQFRKKSPYNTVERVFDVIDAYRNGNCSEASLLAKIFTKMRGIENTKGKALYDKDGFDLDHAVLLVNAKKPYIIDAWLGFADYLPKAFERYNKEFRHCFNFLSDEYTKLELQDSSTFPMRILKKRCQKNNSNY